MNLPTQYADSLADIVDTGDRFLEVPMQPIGKLDEVIRWYGNSYLLNLFEIPIEAARALIPEYLEPMEVRPGIGLHCVAWNRILRGNTPTPPSKWPFDEILSMIVVQSDLSHDMPMPKWCFFNLDVGSNEKSFVDHERESLKLNTSLWPTLGSVNATPLSVEVTDEQGVFFEFRCIDETVSGAITFRPQTYWMQFHSEQAGRPFFGICEFSGHAWEHQRLGEGGYLNLDHSFFQNVVQVLDNPRPRIFMQMMSQPGKIWTERFWGSWLDEI